MAAGPYGAPERGDTVEEGGELAYAGKPTPLLDPACAEYNQLKQEV